MITPNDLQEAEAFCAEQVRHQGLRVVCSWCHRDLPGSDPCGKTVSHGACAPPCSEMPKEWADAVRAAMDPDPKEAA